MTTHEAPTFDADYAAEQLRRSRHPLRRILKGFYLRSLLNELRGPTIDFGCGAGQLLRLLPPGSVGVEVNRHLVEALRGQGLDVRPNTGTLADFDLPSMESGRYRSLAISHVLEHLPDPVRALTRLLAACRRLGIERVVAVVPGLKGFRSDATHLTFIDRAYVDAHIPRSIEGFHRGDPTYFPGHQAWIGRYYTFHEMKLVFGREVGRERAQQACHSA